jgi:hypothetical protein
MIYYKRVPVNVKEEIRMIQITGKLVPIDETINLHSDLNPNIYEPISLVAYESVLDYCKKYIGIINNAFKTKHMIAEMCKSVTDADPEYNKKYWFELGRLTDTYLQCEYVFMANHNYTMDAILLDNNGEQTELKKCAKSAAYLNAYLFGELLEDQMPDDLLTLLVCVNCLSTDAYNWINQNYANLNSTK